MISRLLGRQAVQASLILIVVLGAAFSPVFWGGKTLMLSAGDASSILPSGAYYGTKDHKKGINRTNDAGAQAWGFETRIKVISHQFWQEHKAPIWNPHQAFGAPFAATMQPQPFYPLTALFSLHPDPSTYNIFVLARLFIAGLLTFFFARLFLSFLPSIFAAISFMMSGYFVILLGMPHLSVDILLPGFFLAFELLLRKNSWGALTGVAGIIFLAVLGGMPESLFLIFAFASLYFAFRLVTVPEFRARAPACIGKLALASILGFSLSAFALLPFLELLKVAHDSHQPSNTGGMLSGLRSDRNPPQAMIVYLLPMLFGPAGFGVRPYYWGLLPCLLGGVALIAAAFPRKFNLSAPLRGLTLFFAAALTLMLLKRAGSPVINWIGLLPIAKMVLFVKYLEPLSAFCVAMLAGIGLSQLQDDRLRRGALIAAAAVLLCVVIALAVASFPIVRKPFELYYFIVLLTGVILMLCIILLASIKSLRDNYLAWGLVGLLSLELCFNFIVPSFYLLHSLPTTDANSYKGAPYIKFLQERTKNHERLFAREGVLFPNWASVFGLADVRSVEAVHYERYIHFVRNFFRDPRDKDLKGDLADRFTGGRRGTKYKYDFETDRERRFLELSSVKHVISFSEFDPRSRITTDISDQHRRKIRPWFAIEPIEIDGHEVGPGLLQRPMSNPISYRVRIDESRPILEGSAAIKFKEGAVSSDKVDFRLEIETSGGVEALFSTEFSPAEVGLDPITQGFRIDLSRFAKKSVTLLFTVTDVSGQGADWAGWAELRFASLSGNAEPAVPFGKVYDKEVYIYEVPEVLPRASLFRSVEILPDSKVLRRLKDPDFDPMRKVVISQDSVTERTRLRLEALSKSSQRPTGVARITHYESQRVEIDVESPSPAVLMLNDSNYPGWRAYVDGKPAPMLTANYLFRGVLLPAGKSEVVFAYEPISYRVGALISLVALVLLAAPPLLRRRKPPRVREPQLRTI